MAAGTLLISHLALAQSPKVVRLEIVVNNMVSYKVDVADPLTMALLPAPVAAADPLHTFEEFIGIGNIVSINGKPASGIWTNRGIQTNFTPSPAPGQAIANGTSANHSECAWDIYTVGGKYVGRLTDRGLVDHAVSGGGGAYLGVRGEHQNGPSGINPPLRRASAREDPSMRRTLSGGTWQAYVYLIPTYVPEVEVTGAGPSIFHSDLSPVTASKPAARGEVLILRAKGLGPVIPGPTPPGLKPFGANPYEEVNSPVAVLVNGTEQESLTKIGWPGETDVYRVDFRVPDSVVPGLATLQIEVAWIRGTEVKFPVQ
jgi:hypothetical protein